MTRTEEEDLAMRERAIANMKRNLNAMSNRNWVRRRLWAKQPEFALCLDRTVSDMMVHNTVGFGDLDFEHGAKGPSLGSDEVL